MWKVRMYMSTGFNSINVPDSETTLQSAAASYTDFPVIDCLQRYFLKNIVIRAFEDDVINGDYIKLWDEHNPNRFAFYSMSGYTMTSGDTIDLAITMDPMLSCGGVDNIDFLDGMTSRHHITTGGSDEDNICEDDPYLVPRRIWKYPIGECFGRNSSKATSQIQGDYSMIITSTYDLNQSGEIKLDDSMVDLETTESSTTGLFVTTPVLQWEKLNIGRNQMTSISVGGDGQITSGELSDGNTYYACVNLDKSDRIFTVLATLIAYGRSDVLTSAYLVPKIYIQNNKLVDPAIIEGNGFRQLSKLRIASGPMVNMTGIDVFVPYESTFDTTILYDIFAAYSDLTIYNGERIRKGKHYAHTYVCKESGDSITINPEETQDPLSVRVNVDLRRNGQVNYYIPIRGYKGFEYQNEGSYHKLSGKNWDSANIITTSAQGAALNADLLSRQNNIKNASLALENVYNAETSRYGSILGLKGSSDRLALENANMDPNLSGQYLDEQVYALGYDADYRNSLRSSDNYLKQAVLGNPYAKAQTDRYFERENERMSVLSNSIPQTQIISTASGNSLMSGYGLIVYYNMISRGDVLRFDRILNQFGWKVTEPIKKEFMTNRRDYNYIDASGVSIKCDTVPKSVRNDLSNLFNGGVRIWHRKPYTDYSIENPSI